MFSRSRSGSQRGGGGGRGKQVEQFDQKLMKVVEMQCDQAGYELPEDEGAVESLLNGTKAYIIAVLKDAEKLASIRQGDVDQELMESAKAMVNVFRIKKAESQLEGGMEEGEEEGMGMGRGRGGGGSKRGGGRRRGRGEEENEEEEEEEGEEHHMTRSEAGRKGAEARWGRSGGGGGGGGSGKRQRGEHHMSRSEAGRKGAAARWSKGRGGGRGRGGGEDEDMEDEDVQQGQRSPRQSNSR